MTDAIVSLLTELGLLALPLVTQIVTAITACYTAWRALRHGAPALWRTARAGWGRSVAWLRTPSARALREKETLALLRALKRDLGS